MSKKITIEKIKSANRAVLADAKDGDYRAYYTPVLQVAYTLGCNNVNLKDAQVVTGYRYGKAPQTFISQNYRDDIAEHGLSLAAIDGECAIGSSIFFCNRKIYSYTGVLSGTGADGEPLILCLDAEDMDD